MPQSWPERSAIEHFGGLLDDLSDYLRIPRLIQEPKRGSGAPARVVESLEALWFAALGPAFAGHPPGEYEPLVHGQSVRLEDQRLCEWIPKTPGQLWTLNGPTTFLEALAGVPSKAHAPSGYGSVRLPARMGDPGAACVLGLLSERRWHADFAVPVIVTQDIYAKFLEHASIGAPRVVRLEATVQLRRPSRLDQDLFQRFDVEASDATARVLSERPPRLPELSLFVWHEDQIELVAASGQPHVTGWTVRNTDSASRPFAIDYFAFNPVDEDFVWAAATELRRRAGGDEAVCLTDFDGHTPRLDALLPLDYEPSQYRREELVCLLQDFDRVLSESLTIP